MALETATYISQLVATNPTSTDFKSQGDDHIRLVKSTLQATFPNITGAVTLTQAQINALATSLNRSIPIAVSDETTALTIGTSKVTFRMPHAMTGVTVRASLTTAQSSGSILTIDINESGSSILSTKLTIDNTEKTSTTAATPPVVSDTSLADDAEITIDIDQVGSGTAAGLKVYITGTLA